MSGKVEQLNIFSKERITILKVIARIPRTNSLPKRPVNRLYLDERVQNKNEDTKGIAVVNYNE